MLSAAILFLLIAIACFFFGAGAAGETAMLAAKIFLAIFVILLILSFVGGFVHPGPYWHWPLG